MFIVVENTPGYLPEDDEPFQTEDFEVAAHYALERVKEICDDYIDDSTERFGIPQLLTWQRESNTLWRITFNEPNKLDRVVEILEDEDG